MKLTLYVNGLVFESAVCAEVSIDEAKSAIYNGFESMNKFEMETKDGEFVIIGAEALQNSVLVLSDA